MKTASPTAIVSPGDVVLHPAVIFAVLALAVNDHIAKALWPGVITGKLSDVAGLVFFPLLIVSFCEIGLAAVRRPATPSRHVHVAAVMATAIAFSAVKAISPAGDWYRVAWGFLSLPIRGSVTPVTLTQDITDLLALPALVVAWRIGDRRIRLLARRGESNPQPSDL
jgi:hypothetical protein